MPAAPSAAKIAADNNLDASSVAGSGKRGQVLKGDVLAEANETFVVTLSNASGATIADGTAVGTIVDEEGLLGSVPVRYQGEMVAALTHQSAGDGRRTSSRLEKAYLDCAGKLLDMVSEGTFPNVRDLAMSRSGVCGVSWVAVSVGGGTSSPWRARAMSAP